MSLCFHRMVVYQPVYAKPQQALRPWMETGFLDVRTPFKEVIDEKSLAEALGNFKSWGTLHQHSDMACIKRIGNDIAPIDPEIAAIVSEIRRTAPKRPKAATEPEVAFQLFLHLAQEFDQHSWELAEQLNRLDDQYQALQSSFRQDESIQAQGFALKKPFPGMREDPGTFMIEKRMVAWNRLFQKDPAGPGLLFTDSRFALAYLLDEVDEKDEILKLNITFARAESEKTAKDHPAWADQLREILGTVLTMPWTTTLQEKIVQAGQEIEATIDHWQKSTVKSHARSISFRCYVVPDEVARTLLNRRCGLKSGHEQDQDAKVKNTLVGIIEEGPSAIS